jgi:DNA-binding LacI/PurR family transcriptional regulator
VINNHPDVSLKTYRQVKEVVDRLGFQPNTAARSLVTKRSYTLALITSDIAHYPQQILAAVEYNARQKGYKLFVNVIDTSSSTPSLQDVKSLFDLLSYQVDGVIWAPEDDVKSSGFWNDKLRELNIPVVCISAGKVDYLPFIAVDNRLGGFIATTHLIEQGYKQVGIITGPLDLVPALERKSGWQEALNKFGEMFQQNLIVQGDWMAPSGEAAMHKLLEDFPQIDAVFASNDQMALGAIQAIFQRGKRIPEDIGIVGFDDSPSSAYFHPPLTSISHHFNELGMKAVQGNRHKYG